MDIKLDSFIPTSIPGLVWRNLEVYPDKRGHLSSAIKPEDLDFGINFVEHRFSWSNPNTIRGLHGDKKTWKLMTIVSGEANFVFVDIRKDNFGKHIKTTLSEPQKDSWMQILVPPGVVNGHSTIRGCCLYYAWSEPYSSEQITINPMSYLGNLELKISDRDKNAPKLQEIEPLDI